MAHRAQSGQLLWWWQWRSDLITCPYPWVNRSGYFSKLSWPQNLAGPESGSRGELVA